MDQQLFTMNSFTTNQYFHILDLSCIDKNAEICFLTVTSTTILVLRPLKTTKLRDKHLSRSLTFHYYIKCSR